MNSVAFSVFIVLVAFLYPLLVLQVEKKWSWFASVGPVIWCYLLGLILSPWVSKAAAAHEIAKSLSEVSVALALPLILINLDLRSWFKMAGPAFKSVMIALGSVSIFSTLSYFLFSENGTEVPAMLTGVYTGGTPNMAALQYALKVDSSIYVQLHTYDTLVSIVYLLLVLSVLLKWIAPILGRDEVKGTAEAVHTLHAEHSVNLRQALILLPLSAVCVGLSLGLAGLFFDAETKGMATIISISIMGAALSLNTRIRSLDSAFPLGMFLIYVFSFTIALQADIMQVIQPDLQLLSQVAFVLFGAVMLHLVLSYLFGLKADTFLVTSVAAICSPPFVPLLAEKIRHPLILVSGFTAGIVGYALGNYLGISIALFLQWMTH